jgi:glycerophosphoryl diester phosphodiesterase
MKIKHLVPILFFCASLISTLLPDIYLSAARPARASSVLVIAHRGGIFPDIPENTLSNFRMAIQQGTDVIEVDLRSSRDGQILIMHDETLDRTTNGSGNISHFTLEELKQLDAGGGERIPTFVDLLKIIEDTRAKLLLDIKKGPLLNIGKVITLIEQYHCSLDVIAGVRSLADLDSLKKINPNIRTLGFIGQPDQINLYIKAGVDIIRLWPDWIDENTELVTSLREKNVPVWVTIAELSDDVLTRLLKYGVSGFITDHPEKLRMMLEKMDQ